MGGTRVKQGWAMSDMRMRQRQGKKGDRGYIGARQG